MDKRTNSELLAIYPGKLRRPARARQCRVLLACQILTSRPITARANAAMNAFLEGNNTESAKQELNDAARALIDHANAEHGWNLIDTPEAWAAYVNQFLGMADGGDVREMLARWDRDDRERFG